MKTIEGILYEHFNGLDDENQLNFIQKEVVKNVIEECIQEVAKNLQQSDDSRSGDFEQKLQDQYGASDYDMMQIFGTSASEQSQYLKDNPQFRGIVASMEGYITRK